jgi:DNA-binding NarL/FixJ family response regulator
MEEDLVAMPDQPVRTGRSALTARELQVMELVERGMKNKEIAVALGIRTGTVKIHVKHIFEKTGIRGRYGLALSGLKERGRMAAGAAAAAGAGGGFTG